MLLHADRSDGLASCCGDLMGDGSVRQARLYRYRGYQEVPGIPVTRKKSPHASTVPPGMPAK